MYTALAVHKHYVVLHPPLGRWGMSTFKRSQWEKTEVLNQLLLTERRVTLEILTYCCGPLNVVNNKVNKEPASMLMYLTGICLVPEAKWRVQYRLWSWKDPESLECFTPWNTIGSFFQRYSSEKTFELACNGIRKKNLLRVTPRTSSDS